MQRRFGPFQVMREVARGGMGVVYEAVDETIGQRVAIKVLAAPLSQDRRQVERFLGEARALSAVRHEGLVKIFGMGEDEGVPYLIMELLAGETLRRRLPGPLPVATALRVTRQIAATLAAVHAEGIVHRDLKPENVVLVPDPEAPGGERAKVLDFGIARAAGPAPAEDSHLTAPGVVLGTAAYMAPEQCRGDEEIGVRADVYALGVILYEMLAGRPPFTGAREQVIQQHLVQGPAPLSRLCPGLPEEVAGLVARMLDKVAALRPDMAEVAAEIRGLGGASGSGPGAIAPRPGLPTEAEPVAVVARSRPGRARVALACFLLVAITGMMHWWRSGPRAGMVYIPGGTFPMGSTSEEIESAFAWAQRVGCTRCPHARYEREWPQRQVTLSPYWIDRDEVTNQDFAAWLNRQPGLQIADNLVKDGATLLVDLYPSYDYGGLRHHQGRFEPRRGYERRPAALITWAAAQRYCQAQGKRLPTEAEWEYAARGPASYRFPWGDDDPACAGTVFGRDQGQPCAGAGAGPAEVGTAAQDRSAFGVRDLGGNVAEWVLDRFRSRYPACAAPCRDPRVEDDGGEGEGADVRVVRGGAWYREAESCRSAGRARRVADQVAGDIGFRCVREAR